MAQFPIQLSKNQTIAFVMSRRLGDSLLSMIVVNNLVRNGFNVTVFGDYLFSLKKWFPWVTIQPQPSVAQAEEILRKFDVLLHTFNADVIGNANLWHPFVIILEQSNDNFLRIPYVDIQVKFCQNVLQLQNVVRENNMQFPPELIYRKNFQRVVIHPTSSEFFKDWLPQRFLLLAQQLRDRGLQPEFIVSSSERKDWLWIINEGFALPEFASLDAVAHWLYESGWFIGNDSGIGHLASNLGIPTVTLGMRWRIMQRWRPAWALGVVLTPPRWLITRPLKERFWKYFISVKQVLRAFQQLQNNSSCR